MIAVPTDLRRQLAQSGQEHVLGGWDRLDDTQRRALLDQLESLNLDNLKQLYQERDRLFEVPSAERIQPVPVIGLEADEREARRRGEESLRLGQVAVLLVAGGQGSRLGFDHPKGMYSIGPVSGKSLFQLHAEKVLALRRRYGKPVPFLIMTSPATHEETERFFTEHRFFGLPTEEVWLFRQGTMPALDLATGKLLMASPGELSTSPNGHGGTLTGLAENGLLRRLDQRGIQHVFYFQVDNPLVKIVDPVFLGRHREMQAGVSCKVVRKEGPTDRLGNLVRIDGRLGMIEYSDLPEALAKQTDERGQLRIWAGSPAIHFFSMRFLERVTAGGAHLPFHVARKKVPCLDQNGELVHPETENALKFEMFIFDVLPMAERWCVAETSRDEEFVPLKNASGPDSPAVVKQAISNLAAEWLTRAGVTVPRRPDGNTQFPLEISPLYALDAEQLARKVSPSLKITGPLYLE